MAAVSVKRSIKMDNLYGPLSVRITRFDCKYNETHDTVLELEKNGGREGHYKKGRGSPAMLLQPWLQETCKHVFKEKLIQIFIKGCPAMLPQPWLQETCKHVIKKKLIQIFIQYP